MPVYLNVCIGKIKSVLITIQKQRRLINLSAKMNNISMSKAMRCIITNYRMPFIFNKNLKLYFELHNLASNSNVVMSFATIFRIRNYKIFFSKHKGIIIQEEKNINTRIA